MHVYFNFLEAVIYFYYIQRYQFAAGSLDNSINSQKLCACVNLRSKHPIYNNHP